MDAETYRGFIASLKSNGNELVRKDVVANVMRQGWLTARQLGREVVVDLAETPVRRALAPPAH